VCISVARTIPAVKSVLKGMFADDLEEHGSAPLIEAKVNNVGNHQEPWSDAHLAHGVVEDLGRPARRRQKRSDGSESGSPDAWSG